MAENDTNNNEDYATDKREPRKDYDRLVTQQPSANTKASGAASNRDLGTVGGGSIPSDKGGLGSNNPPGGMNTSSSTVDSGGTTVGGVGAGAAADRGKQTTSEVAGSRVNTQDPHARGNIGGRNPSDPQTAMGDRDPKSGKEDRGEPGITDPMTSRDPTTIKQPLPQDSEHKS